jgi:hypothetical protein
VSERLSGLEVNPPQLRDLGERQQDLMLGASLVRVFVAHLVDVHAEERSFEPPIASAVGLDLGEGTIRVAPAEVTVQDLVPR